MTFIPGGCCDDYSECYHRIAQDINERRPRSVAEVAREEFAAEKFRERVETEKTRLRERAQRSLWQRLFPWVITIRRR